MRAAVAGAAVMPTRAETVNSAASDQDSCLEKRMRFAFLALFLVSFSRRMPDMRGKQIKITLVIAFAPVSQNRLSAKVLSTDWG